MSTAGSCACKMLTKSLSIYANASFLCMYVHIHDDCTCMSDVFMHQFSLKYVLSHSHPLAAHSPRNLWFDGTRRMNYDQVVTSGSTDKRYGQAPLSPALTRPRTHRADFTVRPSICQTTLDLLLTFPSYLVR